MENVSNYLWVEKYRPHLLEDVILSDDYRIKFNQFIKEKTIPHLLFSGGPGSGKTTVAKILTDSIINNHNDLLIFNGSTSTGVETIRLDVVEFLSCPSFTTTGIKIVHIEEADYLSQNAQAALRNVMEEYHENGRFLFTINYPYKIIKELHSRFQTYEFKKLPVDYIKNHLIKILQTEKIKYNEKFVNKVIKTYYPDVRMIIGKIQSSIINNELPIVDDISTDEDRLKDILENLIKKINEKDQSGIKSIKSEILHFLSEVEINYMDFYEKCVRDDYLPFWVAYQISKAANSHASAMNPFINLMGMFYNIIDVGLQTIKLK